MSQFDWISYPARDLRGNVHIPGDKSISHRAFILGAIAKGQTQIEGFLNGEDCLATLQALKLMGVSIEYVESDRVHILGVGKHGLHTHLNAPLKINCGNSGTTMRILSGLLSAQNFDSELVGDSSLQSRPMARVSEPLNLMGASVRTTDGRAPLKIKGNKKLQGMTHNMLHASAQVKSALLLAGLYAEGETCVVEPFTTRDHTERMLKAFSYPLRLIQNKILIKNNTQLYGTHLFIPGDISSAAFFMVAASLIPGADITLCKVGVNHTRTGVITLLKMMGADIQLMNHVLLNEEEAADIRVKYAPLHGITIPKEMVSLAIDEFPVILIAAAIAKGETRLSGAHELRLKESDRIASMVEGLKELGIEITALHDGVVVLGGTFLGGKVNSYGDHRIAMAFAVAGALAQAPIKIMGCESVATSFPHFIETARALNWQIEEVSHEFVSE